MRIEWSTVEQLPHIQGLIDTHWRRGHVLARDADLLRWQYGRTENSQRLSALLAVEGNELVGHLGLIRVDFCFLGDRLAADWLSLFFVAEKARGVVGPALLKTAMSQDCQFIGCAGFNDTAGRMYEALGFEICPAVPRLVRVFSSSAFAGLLAPVKRDYPAHAYRAWLATSRSGTRRVSGDTFGICSWSEDTAAQWDDAWQREFAPKLIGTWRDANYLRWRYLNHPRFSYVIRFVRKRQTQQLEGLAVYRIESVRHMQAKVMRVVELLGRPAALKAAADCVVQDARQSQVALADAYCLHPDAAAALRSVGFAKEDEMPAPLPALFQPLDFRRTALRMACWRRADVPLASSLLHSGQFYATGSDGDQDRPN